MRRIVAVIAAACLALAGCGNDESTPAASSLASSSAQVTKAPGTENGPPCKEGCSRQEVDKTGSGCDGGQGPLQPSRLIQDTPLPVSWSADLQGKLALVKANNNLCPGIVWARFQPAPTNKTAFQVFSIVDGERSKMQDSVPGDPTVAAYTVGLYAELDSGKMAQPCLHVDGAEDMCLPAVEVTS